MTDTDALIERLREAAGGWPTPNRYTEACDELEERLSALTRERDDYRRRADDWIRYHGAMQVRAVAAEAALAEIVKTADDAWQAVDDWDDTGGHVGVGRHERAKADGLSVAAGIARAALAGEAT